MNNDNGNRASHARRRPEQTAKQKTAVRTSAGKTSSKALVRADSTKQVAKLEKKREKALAAAQAEARW